MQADNGRFPRIDQIAQHIPRADAGQLVHIPHQQQMAVWADRFEQVIGEHQVQHRGFVDDDHVGVERVAFGTAESFPRLKLQQAMHRFGLAPGCFGQPLGGAPGGGGQGVGQPVPVQQIQQGAHRRRFARARPAGEDGDFVSNGRLDGVQLLRGKLDTGIGRLENLS